MMSIANILVNFTVMALAALLILSQIFHWQRKEYRWDRLRAAVGEELRLEVNVYFVSLVILLLGWIWQVDWIALIALLPVAFALARRTIAKGVFRPVATFKAALLTILSFSLWLLLWGWVMVTDQAGYWNQAAMILIASPLAVAVLIMPINLLSSGRKRQIIAQAKKLRSSLSSLKVIGITGSYGKTTTKYFLGQLLPFAVVSKEHRNSEIVIAQDMRQQLTKSTAMYAVEMSAYRAGEINSLAQLAAPQIGVLTHIGNQHLALFGSQEKILSAKWELIRALPTGGIAVLNADDELIRNSAKNYKGRVIWFSLQKPADVYASDIDIQALTMICQLHIDGAQQTIRVNLCSPACLSSLVAATATAYAAGASANDIFARIPTLKPYSRTMFPTRSREGALVIDDSYSANEMSVHNAVRHLDKFAQADKRIIVVPIIELGSAGAAVHKRIKQTLSTANAKVFVYGSAFHRELGYTPFTNPRFLCQTALANIGPDTVILLEGRVPTLIREKLGLTE